MIAQNRLVKEKGPEKEWFELLVQKFALFPSHFGVRIDKKHSRAAGWYLVQI